MVVERRSSKREVWRMVVRLRDFLQWHDDEIEERQEGEGDRAEEGSGLSV